MASLPANDSLELEAISEFDYVRFTVVDINGVPRGVIVPGTKTRACLKDGLHAYAGLMAFGPDNEITKPKEVLDLHCGNVRLLPDPNTLRTLPWLGDGKYKHGQFLCETFWDKSTAQEACTRNTARRLLNRLESKGLQIKSGMELEFICIDNKTGKAVSEGRDFLVMLTHSMFDSWFTEVEQNMRQMGIGVDAMHTEYCPGQFEFALSPEFGIKSADNSMLFKQGVKEMALKRDWQANFMAKTFIDDNGSGGHFSFSVWDLEGKNNVFYDEESADGLSEMGKHWIAGMLKHADAITALCCITTNCYLRLHGPWCPHKATWGIQDRTAMIRVKNDGPSGTYFENRVPSALFNPYLIMAATIAAGLDGLDKKLTCPMPYDDKASPELPHSLGEAVECLQKDEVMVYAMGKAFVDWFVHCKKAIDLKAVEGVDDKAELLKIQTKQYARLM